MNSHTTSCRTQIRTSKLYHHIDFCTTITFCVIIINQILNILGIGVDYVFDPDTLSYIKAWDESLSHGVLDKFRTPVYPAIIGGMRTAFGDGYFSAIIILQHVLFLISLFYLRKLFLLFANNKIFANILTVIYAFYATGWCSCILTEALSQIGIITIYYTLVKCSEKYSNFALVCLFSLLFAIFLLRPIFVFLIPLFLLYFLFTYKSRHSIALKGIIGITLIGFLELSYCYVIKNKYGIFAPSNVSNTNLMFIAIQEGLLKTEYSDNKEIKAQIRELQKQKGITNSTLWITRPDSVLAEKYGDSSVAGIIKKSQRDQPLGWVMAGWHHYKKARHDYFPITYSDNRLIKHFTLRVKYLHYFILMYLLILSYTWWENKKLPGIPMFLVLTILSNMIVIYLSAQGEWERLLSPSLPLFFILIAHLFHLIKGKLLCHTFY